MKPVSEYVEVTWGEESYSPIPFQTFRVGPFSMRTKVKAGETPEQAMERAMVALGKFAASNYKAKLREFKGHLRAQKVLKK